MLKLRPARWPDDAESLSGFDTRFVTDRIYLPVLEGFAFRLEERAVRPPLQKRYDFWPGDPQERREWDYAVIAEDDEGRLAGFAAAQYVAWNRRVVIHHLYTAAPAFRRRGMGTLLLNAVDSFARSAGARCLWLETQNVNYPAIRFYLASGFRFCGFDDTLYPQESLEHEETAVFFTRTVAPA